ncbi:MAG: ankyrin repeat domain-containing protein [Gammaproteobacteria bacterium]|jgi:ankyrin repeat protein|nr:ankyrin repeat domain-containing protein [Gammaproteobacteria bacterium]
MPKKKANNKQEQISSQSNEPVIRTTEQLMFDAISNHDLSNLKRLYTWSFSSAKAKDDITDSTYSKLLHAAKLGHADIVSFLLFQKYDFLDLHEFNEVNQNPLIEAIKAGFTDVVSVMARHPHFFRKSFKDNEGNTPFHYVGNIKNEATRKKIATILIEAGLSFDFVNHHNAKPNHYAEFVKIKRAQKLKYHSAFSETFLTKPRSENLKDNLVPASVITLTSGLLALANPLIGISVFALSSGYFLTCLQAFKEDKIYKNKIQNAQYEADFIHYILNGNLTQAIFDKYQKQIDVHHLQTTYKSALDLAAQSGHLATVKLLMAKGCAFTRSALNTAIDYGHHNVAQYFLSLKNVDVDFNNKDGSTPFITALHANQPSQAIVKMLLEKGAHTGENTFVTDLMRIFNPDIQPAKPREWKGLFSKPEPPKPQPKKTIIEYVNFIEKQSDILERRQFFAAVSKLIDNASKQRRSKKTASNDVLPGFNKARKETKQTAQRPLQQQKETIIRKRKAV